MKYSDGKMSKKKLSILIYSLAGGGAERVVSILLKELQYKYNITLVLMQNKIDYDIPSDTKIYFLENSNPTENGIIKLLKLPLLGLKYKKFCQKYDIDISLAFTNRPSYISIFSKLFGSNVKMIISERTTPSMMYRHDNLLSKVSKILIKKLYPKADLIIANAEGNRIDLIDNFFIDKDKIITISNPFDLKRIKQLSSNPVTDNIDFNRFTFISVGRLDEGKNHQLLINAFSKLEDTSTQLLILGEGSKRELLELQIIKLKLTNRVFLIGFDNNPYRYFSKSNIFIFTSNYEGFPNVLIEAMACGLPIISTDCKSGPREILAPKSNLSLQLTDDAIEVSEYGILTTIQSLKSVHKAMSLLLKDKKLQKKYYTQSLKRSHSFDKNTIMNDFFEILN